MTSDNNGSINYYNLNPTSIFKFYSTKVCFLLSQS